MKTHWVAYLIGSLAKVAIKADLAKPLVRLAPAELQMTEISFRGLPR
jgi:chromate reductase